MRISKLNQNLFALVMGLGLTACQSVVKLEGRVPVQVPYIRNTANECYYLDDFMPVPNHLVTGKTGSLNLRYYTYQAATYKEWVNQHVILSFYTHDDRCWSLFEESYIQK